VANTAPAPSVPQHLPNATGGATNSAELGNPTVDPFVLGLPLIALGTVALGLQMVGYVNVISDGSPLAIVVAASGLGLLISTIAAIRLDLTPASSVWRNGRSLPTLVLGVVAMFFLSYGALILGLVHGWFGILPANVRHTVSSFEISWLVAFAFIGVASFRLPVLFTVLFAAFDVVLALLLIGTLKPSTTADNIAGVLLLIIAVASGYVFLAVASAASGGTEYPIGRPILARVAGQGPSR
jgi:succinate-acetate transporter protein